MQRTTGALGSAFTFYISVGSILFMLSLFSYLTAFIPMLSQNCRMQDGLYLYFVVGIVGAFSSLVKIVLWPLGLWAALTGRVGFLFWLFPGWFVEC